MHTYRRVSATESEKLVIQDFNCLSVDTNKAFIGTIQNLLIESMVNYSQQYHFDVVETDLEARQEYLGSRVILEDYSLYTDCLEQNGQIKLSTRLIETQTAKNIAQVSVMVSENKKNYGKEFSFYNNYFLDMETRLLWQRMNYSVNHTYQIAEAYCDGLIIDGKSNWRLPQEKELYTLIARPVKNRQEAFGYLYGYVWEETGCHWILRKSGRKVTGLNLDTGKMIENSKVIQALNLSQELQCQVKCVQDIDPKTEN